MQIYLFLLFYELLHTISFLKRIKYFIYDYSYNNYEDLKLVRYIFTAKYLSVRAGQQCLSNTKYYIFN